MYEDYYTIRELSDFYNVSKETISTIVKRNKDIFYEDGLIIISKKELTICRMYHNIDSRIPVISLLTIKSKYRLAFMIYNNDIAKETRELLHKTNINLYDELDKCSSLFLYNKKYENELGNIICSILGKYHKIDQQLVCGKYKIDFVIDDCIAIECDENNHSSYDKDDEIKREQYIISNGFVLFRYNTNDNNMLNFVGDIVQFLIKEQSKTNIKEKSEVA